MGFWIDMGCTERNEPVPVCTSQVVFQVRLGAFLGGVTTKATDHGRLDICKDVRLTIIISALSRFAQRQVFIF